MLVVEYSMKEFLNSVIMVRWEWLLATIIVAGRLPASRLASKPVTRITKRATRNAKLCT